MEGQFNDDDLELSKTAQSLGHSRKTTTGKEVFLGQWGSYEQKTLEYFNMYFRYGHQWHELLIFDYFAKKVTKIWLVAREVTIILITSFIGLKIITCVIRVYLSIAMLLSGTNLVVALQLINPMGKFRVFSISQTTFNEQKLKTKRTTVELCDGDTNVVILKEKRLFLFPKQLKLKAISWINCIL